MLNLIITNTRSKLEDLPLEVAIELNDKLAFKVPNYFFSSAFKTGRWDGFQRFFSRPANTFPTGLLPIVVEVLKEHNLTCKVMDTRTCKVTLDEIRPDYIMESGKTLRDYQIDSANCLINNKIAGVPFMRGVINIATNGGKTVIAESIIHSILPKLRPKDRLLFLTHSKEIGYQAQASISEDLGIKVGLIGDGKWDEQPISVALIPTLSRNKSKPECKVLLANTIGFIADEVHHASSDTWYDTLLKLDNAYIRIGLTGTVDTEDEIKEHKLYSVTGNIVKKISNQYLIENGFSAKPKCYFIPINNPELSSKTYEEAYKEGIVNNPTRNEIISRIVQKERKIDANILILVERTEHGELILEELNKCTDLGRIEFTHGAKDTKFRNQVLKDLKSNKIKVLIATSVLDEGVDADNINTIIYARGMKSSRKLLQGMGRGLRKKSDGTGLTYYDFIDDTSEYLIEHTLQRYNTISQEGFEIVKLKQEDVI